MKPRADAENGPRRVKIGVQYRTKLGKMYELMQEAQVLTLHFSPPELATSGKWHVEARLGVATGPAMADGWGTTATAALSEAVLAWTSHVPLLKSFDWDGVVRELQGVHAV